MPRTYDLIRCLGCEKAIALRSPAPPSCTDGLNHGPTESVTATDNRDVEPLVEALREAHAAITEAAQAFIVVEGTLKKPYEDDPRWSPWTRFIDRTEDDAWPRLCRAETAAREALSAFDQPSEAGGEQ